MNHAYKGIRNLSTALLLAAILLPSCEDDLGRDNERHTDRVTFAVDLPAQWTDRTSASQETHCTAVSRTESSVDDANPLYIHTLEADRPAPVETDTKTSRGTRVDECYDTFSLSGVCYVGSYPTDDDDDSYLTTDYAFNLTYKADGNPAAETDRLLWPSHGKVRFFAFAPTVSDSNGAISFTKSKGTPKITYTVPEDVTKQKDLLTAQTDQTKAPSTDGIELNFSHSLTAICLQAASDMLAGTIHSVTISGVYGTATLIPGSDTWTDHKNTATSYKITKDIKLEKLEGNSDIVHTAGGTVISGTANDDNLTFLLIPQTLPDGAKLTVEFTDDLTNTRRSISGSLAGHEWKPGKIVTYQISPSSIHITPVVEIEQLGSYNTDNTTSANDGSIENPYYNTDIFHSSQENRFIPFSGAIRNLKLNAYIKVTQEGADEKKIAVPFRIKYSTDNKTWENAKWEPNSADESLNIEELSPTNAEQEFEGSIIVAPQSTFAEGQNFNKSYTGTNKLGESETANCYVIDSPGYYSLPLVYGNAIKNGSPNTDAYTISHDGTVGVDYDPGIRHFVSHNNKKITQPYIYDQPDVGTLKDAFILWQDSPGLLDMVKLSEDKHNIEFRVSKNTIAQGNAVIALRNEADEIVWSWHIWVTDLDWSKGIETTGQDNEQYTLTTYVLGYCNSRKPQPTRDMWLKFEFDIKDYNNNKLEKVTATQIDGKELKFKQQEIKESIAGDNTYYQWGRKDAMVPGIYYSLTEERQFHFTENESTYDDGAMTMLNKPIYDFDVKYRFTCAKDNDNKQINTGIDMGYAISHPNQFALGEGTYRNHWHNVKNNDYLDKDAVITSTVGDKQQTKTIECSMYNAWDSKKQRTGNVQSTKDNGCGGSNSKTIYDPCPPGYQVPPANAFTGILHYIEYGIDENNVRYNKGYSKNGQNKDGKLFNKIEWNNLERKWSFSSQGNTTTPPTDKKISLYATGVRDMNFNDIKIKYKDKKMPEVWPAFCMITFIPSSTLFHRKNERTENDATITVKMWDEQTLIFYIDNRTGIANRCGSCEGSNNSYGFPIWPMTEK